ncbi:MAG: hypothetical protein ACFB15_30580 [Cyclobacteriaceae bacterium]
MAEGIGLPSNQITLNALLLLVSDPFFQRFLLQHSGGFMLAANLTSTVHPVQ